MTNETASPEKKALLEAFDSVIRTQADERETQRLEAEARRAARARSRPVLWACAAILLFVSGYLYVEQPEWVFPTRAAPESMAVKEASLRIALANTAQHLERYRQRNGRLPSTLNEAGAHGDGLGYDRIDDARWRLTGQNGGVRLVLASADPLAKFVGNSFEIISRRGR
jgi:hypothetical protein